MLGRGRWKIGFPRSGMTVRGGVVPTGRCGAAYTGRGPVCGTISLRGGGAGRGAAGLAEVGGGIGGVATAPVASLEACAAGCVGGTGSSTGGAAVSATGSSALAGGASTTASGALGASFTGGATTVACGGAV